MRQRHTLGRPTRRLLHWSTAGQARIGDRLAVLKIKDCGLGDGAALALARMLGAVWSCTNSVRRHAHSDSQSCRYDRTAKLASADEQRLKMCGALRRALRWCWNPNSVREMLGAKTAFGDTLSKY